MEQKHLTGLYFPERDFFVEVFGENVYLVGGTVRDYILYDKINPAQDIDLVVTGLSYEDIELKLNPFGKTNTVGKSFAVVKFCRGGNTFDISIPRRDFKKEPGKTTHRNFEIESGPHISLEDDLSRRDFTCNSIALRLCDDRLVDPFDGLSAIAAKDLVMTGPDTFFDDPLRILRAARFASTHRFSVNQELYVRAKDVDLTGLSAERIQDELFRLLLESDEPSTGLAEYLRLTVLEKLFPQLYSLTLTIQDALFHPESDEFGHHTVWIHTLITLEIAKKICRQNGLATEPALALMLAALLHDIGKPLTTRWEFKRGRMTLTSMFHDSLGVQVAEEFLTGLKVESWGGFSLKEVVLNLIKYHHRIYELYRNRDKIGFKAIARLVKDMDNRDQLLLWLDFADRRSREKNPLDFSGPDEISGWLIEKKEELNVNQESIKPLILGRDLLPLGLSPGKKLGLYLDQLYDLQLEGAFSTREGGLEVFKKLREVEAGEDEIGE